MYNQSNLALEIERVIPGLQSGLHTSECEKSIYKQINVLSHYVAEKAEHDEFLEVKQALYLADDLYEKGNNPVKAAIENVLVFSFSTLFMKAGQNRRQLMAIIPITLLTLYMKQVMHPGC